MTSKFYKPPKKYNGNYRTLLRKRYTPKPECLS